MNMISGAVLIAAVGILALRYRPRWEESLWILGISVFMGLLTPVVPSGTAFLVFLSLSTKAVALLGCWIQFSREHRIRKADQAKAQRAKERARHIPAA